MADDTFFDHKRTDKSVRVRDMGDGTYAEVLQAQFLV